MLDIRWWKSVSFIGNLCHPTTLTPLESLIQRVNLSMPMNLRDGASRFGTRCLNHLSRGSLKKIEVRFVLIRRQDFLHRPFFTSFNRLKFIGRSLQLLEHRLCIRINAILPKDHCHFAVRLRDYFSHLRALPRAELHALQNFGVINVAQCDVRHAQPDSAGNRQSNERSTKGCKIFPQLKISIFIGSGQPAFKFGAQTPVLYRLRPMPKSNQEGLHNVHANITRHSKTKKTSQNDTS